MKGENVVTMVRTISPWSSTFDLGEVFQSVTNVFSYEYYMENIYVKGRFDLETKDCLTAGENCLWMSEKGCEIVERKQKTDIEDFTTQGMLYYMGTVNARKKVYVRKNKGERKYLAFDKSELALITVNINGKEVLNACVPPYERDITDYLLDGENLFEIEIVSTARNFFGPFHHIKGRHNEVGHSIFKGYVEFDDPVVFIELKDAKSTWTDESSFAPFGIRNLRIITKEV